MKSIIAVLFSLAALSATAKTSKLSGNHNLPTVTLATPKVEWGKSLASQIPFEKHVPLYNNSIEYTETINKDQVNANATHYFEKEFGSKSVVLETNKHNYTGYGVYMFATDKKAGIPAIYKVYYTINIKVKGKKCHVTMSDFKLENQHTQVSFDYLVKNAKENDAKSIKILSMFEQFNQDELAKLMTTLAAKDNSDYATASLR